MPGVSFVVVMKFHLRIYDNFHYGNESEAYDHGQYDSYDEAVKGAQGIVVESLEHLWEPGISSDKLMAQYCLFGDDPAVLPDERESQERFSARTYASTVADEICRRMGR